MVRQVGQLKNGAKDKADRERSIRPVPLGSMVHDREKRRLMDRRDAVES